MTAAAGEARRFPWDEVIALGLGLLRLSPCAFWAMTPKELAMVTRGLAANPLDAPDRRSLDALIAAFPDIGKG